MSYDKNTLVGESQVFQDVLEQASKIASLNRPVLIIGERGTGKELIAERIHYLSKRWDQHFIKINCGALTESLLESELFGHEVGAFTGATKRKQGRFEIANLGSLFLDEIATMSSRLQEALLRVIEYGELQRVGGEQTLNTDVRIIAATNEDLPTLVTQQLFRADLLDRIAFSVITLPPLRARKQDIQPLAEYYGIQMARELGWSEFPGFSDRVLEQLFNYPWPGNVRELKNVIERAIFHCENSASPIESVIFDPFSSPFRPNIDAKKIAHDLHIDEPFQEQKTNFKQYIEQKEMALIQHALKTHHYHQKKTAQYLGMSYDSLRGYIRKYQLSLK